MTTEMGNCETIISANETRRMAPIKRRVANIILALLIAGRCTYASARCPSVVVCMYVCVYIVCGCACMWVCYLPIFPIFPDENWTDWKKGGGRGVFSWYLGICYTHLEDLANAWTWWLKLPCFPRRRFRILQGECDTAPELSSSNWGFWFRFRSLVLVR